MVKVGIQGSTRPVACSTLAGMAMGTTRDDGSQQSMWVATTDLPRNAGHPFYERRDAPWPPGAGRVGCMGADPDGWSACGVVSGANRESPDQEWVRMPRLPRTPGPPSRWIHYWVHEGEGT